MTGPVVVQKFGGTSVATAACRQNAIRQVRRAREEGSPVAVVVSAMGRRGDPYATDTLLDLLRGDGAPVDPRDYDLIFSCGEAISAAVMAHEMKRAGIEALALTSVQARIYTDGRHQQAGIVRVETRRLQALLADGVVPVVTGGQGAAADTLDFTTLGRGGSDTSAVALGVALGAARVDIFTDVDGVAVCDPRLVAGAPFLDRISCPAMLELARFGAKVMHPRAIEAAMEGGIPVVVRSTFTAAPGTTIVGTTDPSPLVGMAVLPGVERPPAAGRPAALVSVVGDHVPAHAAHPIILSALTAENVEVFWSELAPLRCTVAVPDEAASLAAGIVYRKLFSVVAGG